MTSGIDCAAIAKTLEEAAAALRHHGERALDLTADWRTTLRSTHGGASHSGVSDPTLANVLARAPETDNNNNDIIGIYIKTERLDLLHSTLRHDILAAFRNAADLTVLLRQIANLLPENDRAGIGHCTCGCGRYCEGTKNDRLRDGLAPACYDREWRAKRRTRATT